MHRVRIVRCSECQEMCTRARGAGGRGVQSTVMNPVYLRMLAAGSGESWGGRPGSRPMTASAPLFLSAPSSDQVSLARDGVMDGVRWRTAAALETGTHRHHSSPQAAQACGRVAAAASRDSTRAVARLVCKVQGPAAAA